MKYEFVTDKSYKLITLRGGIMCLRKSQDVDVIKICI